MEKRGTKMLGVGLWLVAGAVVGAGLALLLAPQSGKATRRDIARLTKKAGRSAEVIVDDKYLGQSPLVTYVDRGEDHVIQLSKEGYAGIIKLIDHRELEGQKVYFLVERFEAQK